MQETQKPNKAIVAVIIVVLLAAVAAGTVYVLNKDNSSSEMSTEQVPSTTSNSDESSADAAVTADSYTDGTYTAEGKYQSPGGRESIEVTLAIAAGKIISASATTEAASGTSRQYQSEFKDNFKSLVVGKSIDEIKLSRVAGSSLTSNGFNDALEQIKDKAEA